MAYRPVFYGGLSGNTAGNTTFGSGSYFLAGGNNVTLSQSTNANGSTISVNGNAQSNQVLSLSALGNTTQTSTGTMNATAMNLSGAGIVSVGYPSGASAVISATQSNQAFSAQGGSSAFQTLSFSNANGMSFSNNAGQVQGSYTVPTVTNSSMTMQAGASTLSSVSRVAFGDGNGISFGASTSNNGSITITGTVATTYAASNHSHGNPTLNLTNLSGTTASASNGLTLSLSAAAQSNQNLALSAVGNTTQTSTGTMNATNMQLSGAGIVSVGYSNGSAIISATAGGGGAALSAAGNSVNNGTVVFSNSNGVGFGMAGSTITASYTTPTQTNQTLSQAVVGNTTGNTSGMSVDARSLSLQGAGIISAGVSTSAGGSSLIVSATQSVQTQNMVSVNGSTGNISFDNAANVKFGFNASTVTASFSQTNQNLALSAVGNTTQTSTGTMNATNMQLSGAGNVSIGFSNGSAIISGNGGGGGGAALSAGTQSVSTGTVNFANSNGITFGMSGSNQITASHNGLTTARASNDAIGLNTAQTNATWTVNSSGLSFNGGGYAGTGFSGTNASGTLDTNGLQLSVAAPGGGGGVALYDGANSITSGTASFADGNNVSFGINGQTITGSVPAISSLSATGAVSLSTNGSTISVGAPIYSYARWEYPTQMFTTANTIAQSSLSVQHVMIPVNVSATAMRLAGSFNISSLTAAGTTGSVAVSLNAGIYTLSGSTLSLLTQGSAVNSATFSSAAAQVSNLNSIREITAPLAVNITPGDYWVAAIVRSTTSGSTAGVLTFMGLGTNMVYTSATIGVLGTNNSVRDVYMGQGMYTATATTMPASIPLSAINNTQTGYVQRAAFYHVLYSATY